MIRNKALFCIRLDDFLVETIENNCELHTIECFHPEQMVRTPNSIYDISDTATQNVRSETVCLPNAF